MGGVKKKKIKCILSAEVLGNHHNVQNCNLFLKVKYSTISSINNIAKKYKKEIIAQSFKKDVSFEVEMSTSYINKDEKLAFIRCIKILEIYDLIYDEESKKKLNIYYLITRFHLPYA